MNTKPASMLRRALVHFIRVLPAAPPRLEVHDVVEVVERSDVTTRVLFAIERAEFIGACRAALAAEYAAASKDGRALDHGAALAVAERRVHAEWRLVWGDPPSGHEPRKLGAWAELRSAEIVHGLLVRLGVDHATAEARLKVARDALVHVLPAEARKVVAEILV